MAPALRRLLDRTQSVLPVSDEDIIVRGITAELTDRIVELKRAAQVLQDKYGSLEELERIVKEKSVSPDDHTLYTDLLEWRAIRSELNELMDLLGSI